MNVEHLHQLVHGEEFPIVSGIPAHQHQIVDQCLGQVALLHKVGIVGVSIPLAQLMMGIPHHGRQVNVLGHVPTKGLVQQVVLGGGRQVLHAPHHVGNAHQVVIDYVGKVVSGHAILLDKHHVVQGVIGEGHVTENQIVVAGFPFRRRILANHIGDSCIQLCLNFFLAHVQAVLVVLEHFSPLFGFGAAFIQLFLGAEAVIGVAGCHQLLGIGQVQGLPLGLDIGTAGAANVGAFVPVHAAALQGFINDFGCAFHKAFLIRILNAEDELTAHLPGKEIIIQGSPQSAQVHKARGAGGKSSSDFHFLSSMAASLMHSMLRPINSRSEHEKGVTLPAWRRYPEGLRSGYTQACPA